MMVQRAVELFQQVHAARVRPNTVKSYALLLKQFAELWGAGPGESDE
jgi:hypothetical protein